MMKFLLVTLLLVASVSAWRPSWMPPVYDEDCTYNREDCYHALVEKVDVKPKDGKISRAEIQGAFDKYAPAWMRILTWFSNVDQTLDACDADKDGLITRSDWLNTAENCLPFKKNWCTVQWFKERADEIDNAK
jgi:hypothetical protein